mmetsp:Transcript_6443/g.20277  ORF Transcript_6443/g.20277 Transcript_6443/m.20277 type:complete len:208 (-) Transcript_6443:94-717(-)
MSDAWESAAHELLCRLTGFFALPWPVFTAFMEAGHNFMEYLGRSLPPPLYLVGKRGTVSILEALGLPADLRPELEAFLLPRLATPKTIEVLHRMMDAYSAGYHHDQLWEASVHRGTCRGRDVIVGTFHDNNQCSMDWTMSPFADGGFDEAAAEDESHPHYPDADHAIVFTPGTDYDECDWPPGLKGVEHGYGGIHYAARNILGWPYG